MNVRPFLLPSAAIVVSAVWLTIQRRELSSLESSNGTIAAAIARAQGGGGTPEEASIASRMRAQPFHRGGKIDWAQVAQAARSSDGAPDMRAMVSLQKVLRGLSTAELLAGIEEIRRLDLTDRAREQVESTLIGILAEKDPALALEKCAPDLLKSASGVLTWQFAEALKKWSADDPAAAAAWMDARIADGSFVSKALGDENGSRHRFEAALIESLVGKDPAAAAARLALLPENERAQVFGSHGSLQFKPGQSKALAGLVRSQLPEDQRLPVLTRLSSSLVRQGGYDRVSGTLHEIDATPEERAAIVSGTIREKLTRTDTPGTFEETHAWIAAEAPADADRLTGEALAHLTKQSGFPEAARLALEQQQRSGNDDALVSFLINAPTESRFEILELAERISDPEAREQITNRFLNNPNRSTPQFVVPIE